MSPREFSYKRNLNKFNADLSKWLDGDNYKQSKTVSIEHTYFAPNHAVGYGLNGNSNMVELQTDIIEAKRLRFERGYFGNYGQTVVLYIQAKSNTYRGEHLKSFTRIVVSKDGKETGFNCPQRGDYESELNRKMVQTFGELFCKANEWTRDGYDANTYNSNIRESLKGIGFELVAHFEFNLDLRIDSKAIKVTSNSIVFAIESKGTYNTLPSMISIKKCSKVRSLKLAKLGIETSGYYDHHVNLEIRPEQAKQAKAFARRVSRLKNLVTKKVA